MVEPYVLSFSLTSPKRILNTHYHEALIGTFVRHVKKEKEFADL